MSHPYALGLSSKFNQAFKKKTFPKSIKDELKAIIQSDFLKEPLKFMDALQGDLNGFYSLHLGQNEENTQGQYRILVNFISCCLLRNDNDSCDESGNRKNGDCSGMILFKMIGSRENFYNTAKKYLSC